MKVGELFDKIARPGSLVLEDDCPQPDNEDFVLIVDPNNGERPKPVVSLEWDAPSKSLVLHLDG